MCLCENQWKTNYLIFADPNSINLLHGCKMCNQQKRKAINFTGRRYYAVGVLGDRNVHTKTNVSHSFPLSQIQRRVKNMSDLLNRQMVTHKYHGMNCPRGARSIKGQATNTHPPHDADKPAVTFQHAPEGLPTRTNKRLRNCRINTPQCGMSKH